MTNPIIQQYIEYEWSLLPKILQTVDTNDDPARLARLIADVFTVEEMEALRTALAHEIEREPERIAGTLDGTPVGTVQG